eukprot:6202000-Pleurochrysis_carterae.AAC.2
MEALHGVMARAQGRTLLLAGNGAWYLREAILSVVGCEITNAKIYNRDRRHHSSRHTDVDHCKARLRARMHPKRTGPVCSKEEEQSACVTWRERVIPSAYVQALAGLSPGLRKVLKTMFRNRARSANGLCSQRTQRTSATHADMQNRVLAEHTN